MHENDLKVKCKEFCSKDTDTTSFREDSHCMDEIYTPT